MVDGVQAISSNSSPPLSLGWMEEVSLAQVADGEAVLGPTLQGDSLSGEAERSVQRTLDDLGFPPHGGADGWFGPETAAAVRMFQWLNGLQVTGVVDAQTLAMMQNPDAVRGNGETIRADEVDAIIASGDPASYADPDGPQPVVADGTGSDSTHATGSAESVDEAVANTIATEDETPDSAGTRRQGERYDELNNQAHAELDAAVLARMQLLSAARGISLEEAAWIVLSEYPNGSREQMEIADSVERIHEDQPFVPSDVTDPTDTTRENRAPAESDSGTIFVGPGEDPPANPGGRPVAMAE